MPIEMLKNQIKRDRLVAGRRKSERKRRKVTLDELWEEYFRLSNLAHQAFEAVQARQCKEAAAAIAMLIEAPAGPAPR